MSVSGRPPSASRTDTGRPSGLTQTVEYVCRIRLEEPPDDPAIPEENRVGPDMADLWGEVEAIAVEQEITSRRVVASPDGRPRRVKCPTAPYLRDRHMVTDHRWTVTDPDGVETVLCSAACALWWICSALPADVAAVQPSLEGAS
jgi:hypothetical protein